MKKVIFGTALASMALLSACSSDNELANVETAANNAIGFHVVGNKAETRANIINSTKDLEKTDFNVYAYINNADGNDGTPFMGGNDTGHGTNGININHKGSDWAYTNEADLRYWPTTALNFYAVSPATTGMFSWQFSNTQKEIIYNCCDEYKHTEYTNHDAMYAVAKNQTYSAENGGKVKFQFKHILSQVEFKAKTQYANMEVEIQDISIHNFRTGGTFTISSDTPAQSDWKLNDIAQKGTGFTVKAAKENENIIINTSTEATKISDGAMLFVPQKLTKWDLKGNTEAANTAEQSYLKITCKIKQSNAYLFGSDTKFGVLYVPFEADWQPGKHYIYTLIFGGGYNDQGLAILKPINFEAETSDWVDGTGSGNIDM